VELARPMRVTFHRAFDEAANLEEALEDVIATGADCLLTSGGAANCLAGAGQIARLVRQAAGRIQIMAGAGLTLDNLKQVTKLTDAPWVHGSLTRRSVGKAKPANLMNADLEADARAVLGILSQAEPVPLMRE
jgi:copper homeostasis protein